MARSESLEPNHVATQVSTQNVSSCDMDLGEVVGELDPAVLHLQQ